MGTRVQRNSSVKSNKHIRHALCNGIKSIKLILLHGRNNFASGEQSKERSSEAADETKPHKQQAP